MIRKILVPLDGSQLAETALPLATAIASRTGASLTLIRAAKYNSLLSDVAADQYRVISTAEQYLEELTQRLSAQGLTVESGVPFGGTPAEWIVEESEVRQIDMVIMATHARAGADHWLHGSVAEAVIHRLHVPVMLARAGEGERLAQRFGAQQPVVLVPLDGSELAESALPFAADLAHSIAARVVLVGVVPGEGQLVASVGGAITTYAGEDHTRLDSDARTYLGCVAERVVESDVDVEIVIRYGEAAAEIIAQVESAAPAAVVMATHGRTGIARSMFGSVAGAVAYHIATPVVLIHPPNVKPAEASATHIASTVG